MYKKLVIIFFHLGLLPLYSLSQDLHRVDDIFKVYDFNQSLVSRDFKDIDIDHNGYLWIATETGVLRFDGHNFYEVNASNQEIFFPTSSVDYIEYYDGKVFLVSNTEGLITIDVETFEVNYPVRNDIYDITIDRKNKLIYALDTDNSLMKIKDGEVEEVRKVGDTFGLIEVNDQGIYFALKNDGIYFLDHENTELLSLTSKFGYPVPSGFREQFFKFNSQDLGFVVENILLIIPENNFDNSETLKLCEKGEYLLINTRELSISNGLSDKYLCNNKLFQGEIRESYNQEVFNRILPGVDIRRLLIINNGDLLLATNQGLKLIKKYPEEINTVNDIEFSNFSSPRVRRAIIETGRDERLLLGYPGLYLLNADGIITEVETVSDILFFDAIKIDEYIYATTEGNGFVKLNKSGDVVQISNFDNVTNQFHYSINELNETEVIAGGKGLVSIFDKNFEKYRSSSVSDLSYNIENGDIIMDIHVDYQKRGIWLATESGLSLFDNEISKEVRFFSNRQSSDVKLNNKALSTILQSETGDTLWVAGDRGIDIIDVKRESYIQFVQNTSDNRDTRVTGMVKDSSGNIWASTYDGIIVIDSDMDRTIFLDKRLGLINQEYNYKSISYSQDGKVIMGGVSGYDIIDTSLLDNRPHTTQLYLTMVEYVYPDTSIVHPFNNQEEGQPYSIDYRTDKSSVKLFFSALNLSGADSYSLEYKIDESQWLKMDASNTLLLNNLAYGSYQISVRSENLFGEPFENTLQVNLHAEVPFYYTNTFHFFILVLIFSLIIISLYYLTMTYKNEIKLKNRISMDLHDVVGTSLTRSTLLLEEYMDRDNRYHQRILKNLKESQFTLRTFISRMSNKKLSFEEMVVDIRETLFQLLSNNNLSFKLHVEDDIGIGIRFSEEFVRDITISLYELCTNTLKHAGAESVDITLKVVDKYLILEFEDDGELKELSDISVNPGYGLKNLEKRLVRYKGGLITKISKKGTGLKLILSFKTV